MPSRDEPVQCLSCTAPLVTRGSRRVCERCDGCLVPAVEVEDMLHTMFPGDTRTLESFLEGGNPPRRTCPFCATRMENVLFGDIAIDRCRAHGLWFDPEELGAVLESRGKDYVSSEPGRDRDEPLRDGDRIASSTSAASVGRLITGLVLDGVVSASRRRR